MPKKPIVDQQDLLKKILLLLSQSGPTTTQEICARIDISQPTFSRLITQNTHILLRIGQGPKTLYAVARNGAWGKPDIPVFSINEKGTLSQAATLYPLAPKGFYLESKIENLSSRIYEALPYFFEDLRPSGFLGRLVPRLYPELDLPQDIQTWTDDHNLFYLTRYGYDLIGNFLIGENSYETYLKNRISRLDVTPKNNRKKQYPHVATLVLSKGIPGSSAGGEQPKFLSIVETKKGHRHVLVKFSPPVIDTISQRIADLLVCEHLAHEVLKQHKHQAPASSLLWSQDRLFLESERFDRNTHGGRRGIISLRALDLEFVGQLKTWTETAESLCRQKVIDQKTYHDIVWLEVFGKLIGNTDRHHGNISFFCEGEKITGMAPIYDMLPMMYAPQQNQLVERPFDPVHPKVSELPVWERALAAVLDFWTKVQTDPEISKGFKKLTALNTEKLNQLKL
ncbi:MAG: type II toxin-antitoxin system HipA family toxin YjjJ [Deltaproteobacteria bacterium]|nr:MAG: type II toxin-antitoxin system HipA family toxin YjjJ [Deltaproteobacteria bacterium]